MSYSILFYMKFKFKSLRYPVNQDDIIYYKNLPILKCVFILMIEKVNKQYKVAQK
ncbi:hypothetical protein D9M68_619360 [compost metagenome]